MATNTCPLSTLTCSTRICPPPRELQFGCGDMPSSSRRQFLAYALLYLNSDVVISPSRAWAGSEEPNEKTQLGKVLPKAYLKSARELVKTLSESINEDPKDMAKFRRNADAAKESIREYLNGWRGQSRVVNEESYVMIEKAMRALAKFYSKAGPSAPLPEDVKAEILSNLTAAQRFL